MTVDAQSQGLDAPLADREPASGRPARRLRPRRRVVLGGVLVLFLALGASGYWASAHPDRAASLLRRVVGDERTAQIESVALNLKDRKDRLVYRFFGGRENPFGETALPVSVAPPRVLPEAEELPAPVVVRSLEKYHRGPEAEALPDPPKPAPMKLPETRLIQASPAAGEGVWVVDGLPRSSVADVLMAKTYIRPDTKRPYASVGMLLIDKRRVRLHVVGGTTDPGAGPGRIPDADRPNLLLALNGGFQKAHGRWGMYMDGVLHKPLREGYASLVVRRDGTVEIGQWGKGNLVALTDDMVAVRQNAVLLVEDGEITPAAKNQGTNNDVWGYVTVNSAEFITWRTAIGLTKDGNLIIAAGNSLSAGSLATAMQAAGAYVAMQLDINTPHVNVALINQQADGSNTAAFLMDTMPGNPTRYLGKSERDFVYLTLDETNYRP